MEEVKKSSSVFIIIIILLLFIVGCLLGYICLNKGINQTKVTNESNKVEDKNTTKKEAETTPKEEVKTNSIVGEYQYSIEGNIAMSSITGKIIDFMEDGTYYEKVMSSEIDIIYGEYKVEGNTITLVAQFRHSNSQDGLDKTQKTYTYEYNSDGTITDSSNISVTDHSVLKQTYKKNGKVNEVKKELINFFIADIENHK